MKHVNSHNNIIINDMNTYIYIYIYTYMSSIQNKITAMIV